MSLVDVLIKQLSSKQRSIGLPLRWSIQFGSKGAGVGPLARQARGRRYESCSTHFLKKMDGVPDYGSGSEG